MKSTLEKIENKSPVNHQLLTNVDSLNEEFSKNQREFERKIEEFNRKVLIMVESLIYFEEKMKQQFSEVLNVSESVPEKLDKTPMKEINNNSEN